MPWYNLPGNHDMNLEAPDNAHSRETFKRVFGARHAAFQYAGVTFLTLDNVEYLGTDPSKPNGFGKYRGHFGPDQLTFVRNVLAGVPGDSLVVICHHIPLIRTSTGISTCQAPQSTTITCWPPSPAAGGAARSTSAASPSHCKAMAARTASTCCQWTAPGT